MNNKFESNKTTSKSLSQISSKTVINNDGEVLSTEQEKHFKVTQSSEPAYIKFYLQDPEKFSDLKKGTDAVLKELFKYVSYNSNLILLNSTIRKNIAIKLGIKEQTLGNALNELKKHQLLIHIDKNVYMANTLYFAKGEWSKIKKLRNDIGIEVIKIKTKSGTKEVTKFNFYKFRGIEVTDEVITPVDNPPLPKNINRSSKNKLYQFFSMFRKSK